MSDQVTESSGGHRDYRIRLIFHWYFISWKQAKVGSMKFSQFLFSRTNMWASFPDVLNLIFAVCNFANGHQLVK